GDEISGLKEAGQIEDLVVFHAGTAIRDGQIVTSGGRVLGVTALGDTVQEAIDRAYRGVAAITWEGAHYRKDIGQKAVKR
ncbi:MAG TPA: phosphoribosylglycinamide synthetase C domain-containing protein, partial [Geobacteraceae bacterium]|nr:phosphoribosylglycinamide synthetase C domain-containing protein [Geobacteraceae bacterium]